MLNNVLLIRNPTLPWVPNKPLAFFPGFLSLTCPPDTQKSRTGQLGAVGRLFFSDSGILFEITQCVN